MAIRPNTEFPTQTTAPSTAYPGGAAQNVSAPSDGTGTPWKANLINDFFGFQQAIIANAAITPSDTPDTAIASQYLQGLQRLLVGVTPGSDKKYRIVSAVIENSGSGWDFVYNEGLAFGAGGPAGGLPLKLADTSVTPTSPIQLMIMGDKALEGNEISLGTAHPNGLGTANVMFRAPLRFTLDMSNGTLSNVPAEIDSEVSAAADGEGWVITHPQVESDAQPTTSRLYLGGGSNETSREVMARAVTTTTTRIQNVGPICGRLKSNGATLAYTGEMETPASAVAGVDNTLVVTHPNAIDENVQCQMYNEVTAVLPAAVLGLVDGTVDLNSFSVILRATDSPTPISPTSAAMDFSFNRGGTAFYKKSAGSHTVSRGVVSPVVLADVVGQITVFGVVELEG